MKKYFAKIALITLITAGFVTPVLLRADDSSTNSMSSATSSDMAPAKPKKKHGLPFHGTLDEMDTNAMTLTVGSRTFQITSKTKIKKDGQPAVLADGVVGQPVSGYYHTNEDGGLDATTINFGMHKHKAASSDSTMSTNTPSSN
jgi:hypothetical protein